MSGDMSARDGMDGLRVLLVDDEELYLRTAAKIFKRSGIETAVCSDGRNVPALVRTRKCQVVVLDLKLPGVDGLDILRELKRVLPSVQVIMLTGHATADDAALCMTSGAFDFLVKPVDMSHLLDRVRTAFELWKIGQAHGGGGR